MLGWPRVISAEDYGKIEIPYVLNRGEYVYFFHEARNLLLILGFYNLTSDLSTTSAVHSQVDSRKASASEAVRSYNEVTYFLMFTRVVLSGRSISCKGTQLSVWAVSVELVQKWKSFLCIVRVDVCT